MLVAHKLPMLIAKQFLVVYMVIIIKLTFFHRPNLILYKEIKLFEIITTR